MEPLANAATSGSAVWIVAVNLVIWTGLFLFLLRLERKLKTLEKNQILETGPEVQR